MIYWKDFIIDDFLGPILAQTGETNSRTGVSSGADVMDDRNANAGALGSALIQETRRGQQPARMVGQSGLEDVRFGTDADRVNLEKVRAGGRG